MEARVNQLPVKPACLVDFSNTIAMVFASTPLGTVRLSPADAILVAEENIIPVLKPTAYFDRAVRETCAARLGRLDG
jgi:hypothetical protein